jgi:hypothetical protein
MAQEYVPIDISQRPDLKRLAHAVRESGKPFALQEGAETLAIVQPAPKKEPKAASPRPPRRRSRVFTMDDPLWSIVGIAKGARPENVSGNVDKYLAEAYLDNHS